jgi:mono/diheme cytochrome c family protein
MAETTIADVYATNCAACHGAELEGGVGPGLGPGGHSHGHADAELVAIITNGKNAMPAFVDKLTEQPIVDLVAFIREADDSS